MKLTIELDEELRPALEAHLESGVAVQNYFRAALRFFNDMYRQEKSGSTIGFSSPSSTGDQFRRYNTEASPARYLMRGAD